MNRRRRKTSFAQAISIEKRRIRAALSAIHDRLHAGDVDGAHELCECALSGETVSQPNISAEDAARGMTFADEFNAMAKRHELPACAIVIVPSTTVEGAVSLQLCGNVAACKIVETQLRGRPSTYMGDHAQVPDSRAAVDAILESASEEDLARAMHFAMHATLSMPDRDATGSDPDAAADPDDDDVAAVDEPRFTVPFDPVVTPAEITGRQLHVVRLAASQCVKGGWTADKLRSSPRFRDLSLPAALVRIAVRWGLIPTSLESIS